MKTILVLVLLMNVCHSFTQQLPSKVEIYNVVNQFLYRTDSSHIYLKRNASMTMIYRDSNAFLSDTSYFMEADFDYFRSQMKELIDKKWNTSELNKVETISPVRVKWIFRGSDGWKRFHRKYPKSCIRTCSMPLFTVDRNYCIFYTGTQCGEVLGRGSTNIYKLENGKWIYIDSYGIWVS